MKQQWTYTHSYRSKVLVTRYVVCNTDATLAELLVKVIYIIVN